MWKGLWAISGLTDIHLSRPRINRILRLFSFPSSFVAGQPLRTIWQNSWNYCMRRISKQFCHLEDHVQCLDQWTTSPSLWLHDCFRKAVDLHITQLLLNLRHRLKFAERACWIRDVFRISGRLHLLGRSGVDDFGLERVVTLLNSVDLTD